MKTINNKILDSDNCYEEVKESKGTENSVKRQF